MKLSEHVDIIRSLTEKSFDKLFSRLGLGAKVQMEIEKLPAQMHSKRAKIDQLIESHIGETGTYVAAREKALDELTFTLFNRLAALKVMEAHRLFPEAVTKKAIHGDRSFAHKAWLEENPAMRDEEMEGIREFFKYEFNRLAEEIGLYAKDYQYALLPGTIELNEVIEAINAVEEDAAIDSDIWQSDDILGWLYESYNNPKKKAHKDSKAKTEYDKVSIQSQYYTPRWVVQFLVNNSLGKLYMEMYPDSEIKEKYAIANAPDSQIRETKSLHEIKLIDPATGSGNFLLYSFDLFYDLYIDQIENYDVSYDENEIPRLIIENNLYGIDLDNRAIQLAQLGLYIKAKRKRLRLPIRHFNVVSSNFFLPDYEAVKTIFENNDRPLSDGQRELVQEIWGDLQQAYRFGALVRIGEKVNNKLEQLVGRFRRPQMDMFAEKDIVEFETFRDNFFLSLEKAITLFAKDSGDTFLSKKTRQAIIYLRVLTSKYDLATANPPFTQNKKFGDALNTFIWKNYSKPSKFHKNLYSVFIKRCSELILSTGKIAMIHPLSFMFTDDFKDVRNFILENFHINILVHHGPDSNNIFDGSFASAPAYYILEKTIVSNINSLFISLDQYTRTPNEKNKKVYAKKALENFIKSNEDVHNFPLPQSKLKLIKASPFVYWISDNFRKKFQAKSVSNLLKNCQGLATGENIRFVRYWWEINSQNIANVNFENRKWVNYAKGGSFKKWAGNVWLVVNWENEGKEIKGFTDEKGKQRSRPQNEDYYFMKGITYSAANSKGTSFRILPSYHIFDVGGSSIFPVDEYSNIEFILAFMNSKLTSYIVKCLNPTVNTQVGDIGRVPFIIPEKSMELEVEFFSKRNIQIMERLEEYILLEKRFKENPINWSYSNINKRDAFNSAIKYYLNYENYLFAQILINEAILNEKIFEIYDLSSKDKSIIIEQEGKSIGELPITSEAKLHYLKFEKVFPNYSLSQIKNYILSLPEISFSESEKTSILEKLNVLYKSNNDLEEFCKKNQINPINVWYWFKESNTLPTHRAHDITMEFLADMIRELLHEDEDGIIPLVENSGEEVLYSRIEKGFVEKGFSMAQFGSLDTLLGRELNDYLNGGHFFKDLSDHLNLFMYLPKTPFIWHVTSGEYRAFDCFILIYKWNKDRLYTLKSIYLEKRERALINKQSDLANDESAKAQAEKELIRNQLTELKAFRLKIDELIAEGYDPKLDDGVGKNIAPLQDKGMLAYDVLNAGQLKKYLNADW